MWHEDTTGISVGITLVFLIATAHGSLCLLRLSRSLNHLGAVQRTIVGERGKELALPDDCVGRYIHDLHTKAILSGRRPVDQGLLLDTFEAELRQGHLFGR